MKGLQTSTHTFPRVTLSKMTLICVYVCPEISIFQQIHRLNNLGFIECEKSPFKCPDVEMLAQWLSVITSKHQGVRYEFLLPHL